MKYFEREWLDENLLNKFKGISGLILEYKLAIENYEDFNDTCVEDSHKLEAEWRTLRENSSNSNENDVLNKASEILEKYKGLVSSIGNENFIFYKDGSLEYKVKK